MSATLVSRVFEPGGLLSRGHPGFEPRPSQLQMSEGVDRAFTHGRHLLVEAPPGTGKTFAYLVPAVASGRTVVISTGTKTLQDQLFLRDIPLISKVLGRPIRAALMKGRENYLCLHRLQEVAAQRSLGEVSPEADPEESRLRKVRAWAEETETGDRAEMEGLPEPWKLWEKMDARSDTCLGQQCPLFDPCFLTRMRRKAAEADLIVVNHHLLMSDLILKASAYGAVIPPYRLVILDEAHMLEEVATSHLGRGISSFQIRDLLSDVSSLAAQPDLIAPAEADRAAARGRTVRSASERFFSFFLSMEGRFHLAELREEAPWLDAGRDLAERLMDLGRTLESLPNPSEGVDALSRRAADLSGVLTYLLDGDDEEKVMWGERRGRGFILNASPIEVSGPLRELLFDSVEAAALTSATLTVDGTFDFIRSRVGPPEGDTLTLDTPFDLKAQSILYLPRRIPDPGTPGFGGAAEEEILSLLSITSGRAFVLFTSFASMHRTRDALEGQIPYPLMMQGDASRHVLLESFRKTPNAVLLATASFWQGVDVPGEALSLVVIEKIPFDVPSDPIVAARCEAVRRGGGNPFMDYQIPSAVIDLKQGLGRLLRARSDRGVLAVLDGRLRTRRYGPMFLKSLPPYPVVESLDRVRDFFQGARPPEGDATAPEIQGAAG